VESRVSHGYLNDLTAELSDAAGAKLSLTRYRAVPVLGTGSAIGLPCFRHRPPRIVHCSRLVEPPAITELRMIRGKGLLATARRANAEPKNKAHVEVWLEHFRNVRIVHIAT
jgi:hypothetical protein